jgi:hypothetical protein
VKCLRHGQAGVPQSSVLSPILYSLYINDTPQTLGVYLGLFTDDTFIYATDHRKLQRGLSAIETWCERWNIKINEDRTQAIYCSHRLRPPEARLKLHGQNIPFVNLVKYLCVTFDKRIIWRLQIEMTEAKAFRTFIRVYFLFKKERLSANIKLTLHKTLIRSVMIYACTSWELRADTYLLQLQCLQNKVFHTIGNFPRYISLRDLHTAFNLPYACMYICMYVRVIIFIGTTTLCGSWPVLKTFFPMYTIT